MESRGSSNKLQRSSQAPFRASSPVTPMMLNAFFGRGACFQCTSGDRGEDSKSCKMLTKELRSVGGAMQLQSNLGGSSGGGGRNWSIMASCFGRRWGGWTGWWLVPSTDDDCCLGTGEISLVAVAACHYYECFTSESTLWAKVRGNIVRRFIDVKRLLLTATKTKNA